MSAQGQLMAELLMNGVTYRQNQPINIMLPPPQSSLDPISGAPVETLQHNFLEGASHVDLFPSEWAELPYGVNIKITLSVSPGSSSDVDYILSKRFGDTGPVVTDPVQTVTVGNSAVVFDGVPSTFNQIKITRKSNSSTNALDLVEIQRGV